MKSLFYSPCFLFLFSIFGCATASPGFVSKVNTNFEENIADISIETLWKKDGGMVVRPGIYGFHLIVKNATDDVISIVWSKSSLSYNGKSYIPFIEGQKYANATSPESPMIVPANGITNVNLFSAGQVTYISGQYGGWVLNTIQSTETHIVLCIESLVSKSRNRFYHTNSC
jgi:hypothetical protein